MAPASIRHFTRDEGTIPWVPAASVVGSAKLSLQRFGCSAVAEPAGMFIRVRYRDTVPVHSRADAGAKGVGGGKEAGVDSVIHEGKG